MAGQGDVVGAYTLVRRLGSGGMGTVWEAHDEAGTAVALKLLHPAFAADPAQRARLEREVASLNRLRGSHVARVLDAEIGDEHAFVVTQLVDGLSLEESVDQEGAFDPVDLYPLARGLYAAVEEVHRAGLLHRDIKPGNVMVTYDGPVLIDFGIAQLADEERLTRTGFVTGSPGYLDPAMLHGGGLGREGDWYGVAAVLLFAATGRPPFGRGRLEVVLGRMTTTGPDLDGLPSGLAGTFRAALAADPALRPKPRALLDALRRHADGKAVVPPPGPPTPPAAGAASGVAGAAGAAGAPGVAGAGVAGAPGVPHLPPPAGAAAPGAVAPPSYPPQGRPLPPVPPVPTGVPATAAWPGSVPGPVGTAVPGAAGSGPVVGPDGAVPAWAGDPPSRPGLVGLSGAVVCTAAVGWPGLAIYAVVVGFVLLTLTGMLHRRTRLRRLEAGPRRSDGWVAAGWSVPLLVPAAVTALLPLLIGAVVAASVWTIGTTLVLQDVLGDVPDSLAWVVTPVSLAAGLTLAWWVPVSQAARIGARVVWSHASPTRTATWVWVGLGVAAAVVLLAGGLTGPQVWAPLPTPPSLG